MCVEMYMTQVKVRIYYDFVAQGDLRSAGMYVNQEDCFYGCMLAT